MSKGSKRTKLSENNMFEIGGGRPHRHTHNLALYIRICLGKDSINVYENLRAGSVSRP